ncbi:PREDICTED: glutamate receptor ionotropic, kainate 2-like isoform X2 [Nicrophorus vespilloides]|uniref:Glutamate receptor ionotropic, kainate 2-like isoform X2 n=1 Tax=Nicrophorus vespilloides TaxID=110193 RepID=A0ABM1MKI3_NICVS|nr:PREDICTED: glutamate receptor ionotropic, kainate 2-like isoform X2 [Nicrophorus vespilloides]
MKVALWILFFLAKFVHSEMDLSVVEKYFQYRNIKSATILTCFNKKDRLNLFRQLITVNANLIILDMSDANFDLKTSDVSRAENKHLGLLIDMYCPEAVDVLDLCSKYNAFNVVHHWLIFLPTYDLQAIFQNVSMTIASDVTAVVKSKDHWDVFDIYNQAFRHGGKLKIYFQQCLFDRFHGERISLYWRRKNMTGVTFKAMVVLPRKFEGSLLDHLMSDEHREVNTFNRFHSLLVYHVRDFYNFTLDMSWTPSWGFILPNGTFDGLVRALQIGAVDFGATPLFVKPERLPFVDYGRPTWILRSAFIFKRPKRPASFEVFLRPLDGMVWCLTVISIILIVVLFKISLNSERRIKVNANIEFENTWSSLFLCAIGAICQQAPKSITTRVLFIFMFIFTILLYQFYSASIVSTLLMTPEKFIKTIDDLIRSHIYLSCEDTLYNRDYLAKIKNRTFVKLLEDKALKWGNESFYMEPEMGLRLVAKGDFAYQVEMATAYPIIKRTFDDDTICSLDAIELLSMKQTFQALPKGSPFKDMMNTILQKIAENGLLRRQLNHWSESEPACIRATSAIASSVSIEEFYPALSVLAIGLILSINILLVEVFINYRSLRQTKSRTIPEHRTADRDRLYE